MVSILISVIAQLAIAASICAIAWLVFGRRSMNFAEYIGLAKAPLTAMFLALGIGAVAAAFLLGIPSVMRMAAGTGSVATNLAVASPVQTLVAILLVAIVQTSLTEEMIFRGLIGKALIRRFSFQAGNTMQALLFGAVHLLLFLIPESTASSVAILFAFTTLLGWINGWLMEAKASGSIIPAWIAHATANSIAYSAIAMI